MTEAEMKAATVALARINSLRDQLRDWRDRLATVNKHAAKAGSHYPVDVTIKEPDGYGRRGEKITIHLDAGVVQQSLINCIGRLEREMRALGGTP